MIAFDLGRAHPEHQHLAHRILEPLDRRWPGICRRVMLYSEKPGDRSLGRESRGVIELNPYWFSRPPQMLRVAAAQGARHGQPGIARWHDGASEPEHTLVHEFGHCLRGRLGDRALRFAREGHRQAVADPALAPTGYALVDAEEWFAEAFMCSLVGSPEARGNRQVRALLAFLGD